MSFYLSDEYIILASDIGTAILSSNDLNEVHTINSKKTISFSISNNKQYLFLNIYGKY